MVWAWCLRSLSLFDYLFCFSNAVRGQELASTSLASFEYPLWSYFILMRTWHVVLFLRVNLDQVSVGVAYLAKQADIVELLFLR